MKQITIEEAEKLALETDYAVFAVGEEINTADAGAFFLEGFNYAMKQINQFGKDFAVKLIQSQKDIDPEIAQIVNDNFWEML